MQMQQAFSFCVDDLAHCMQNATLHPEVLHGPGEGEGAGSSESMHTISRALHNHTIINSTCLPFEQKPMQNSNSGGN